MISLYDHGNVICCKEKQAFSFYAYNVTEGKEKAGFERKIEWLEGYPMDNKNRDKTLLLL